MNVQVFLPLRLNDSQILLLNSFWIVIQQKIINQGVYTKRVRKWTENFVRYLNIENGLDPSQKHFW